MRLKTMTTMVPMGAIVKVVWALPTDPNSKTSQANRRHDTTVTIPNPHHCNPSTREYRPRRSHDDSTATTPSDNPDNNPLRARTIRKEPIKAPHHPPPRPTTPHPSDMPPTCFPRKCPCPSTVRHLCAIRRPPPYPPPTCVRASRDAARCCGCRCSDSAQQPAQQGARSRCRAHRCT